MNPDRDIISRAKQGKQKQWTRKRNKEGRGEAQAEGQVILICFVGGCGGGGVSEKERREGGEIEVGKHKQNLAKRRRWFKQGGNGDSRKQWVVG